MLCAGITTYSPLRKWNIGKGHKVGFGGYYGGYQAIMYDPVRKVFFGASESRKDGAAAGY